MRTPLIIVHGGAGKWKDERIPIASEQVEKAAIVGFQVLEKGGSALDAAEECTIYMETCGKLNCGVGARANLDGVLELDAMIVDGKSLQSGAVMAAVGVRKPTSLARYIMEKTDYNQIAGTGARVLYEKMIAEGYREEISPGVTKSMYHPDCSDTVGCIVVDKKGNIATTSSTGGIPKKIPGRVGDSPIFGAGAYANSTCGATATGFGEHIVRVLLSYEVVRHVEDGLNVQDAAERGLKLFEEKTGSEAGIIVADKYGNYGYTTNAKAMPTVVIQGTMDDLFSTTCQ